MMKTKLILFVLAVYLPSTLMADAGSIANSIVDHSEKIMNEGVTRSGREFAYQEAGNNAATGAGIAAATGAALTGAAVAQFLLGNWGVGGALMGMAGMEFAQMTASGNTAQTNVDRYNLVTNTGSGDLGTGAGSGGNSSSVPTPELPASLDKYLAQAGVDPNLFKDALLSGKLTDGASVMEALGKDPSLVREADSAKALELAQDLTANTGSEIAQSPAQNDSTKPQTTYQNKNGSEMAKDWEKKESSEVGGDKKIGKSTGTVEPGFENELAGSPALLRSLFGAPTDSFTLKDQGLLFEMYLKDQGLVKTRPGMNIFQIAKQNFRGFSKWRTKTPAKKNTRVASMN